MRGSRAFGHARFQKTASLSVSQSARTGSRKREPLRGKTAVTCEKRKKTLSWKKTRNMQTERISAERERVELWVPGHCPREAHAAHVAHAVAHHVQRVQTRVGAAKEPKKTKSVSLERRAKSEEASESLEAVRPRALSLSLKRERG